MRTDAYLGITEQTLWEETGMQHLSVNQLIADARRILDELEQRSFSPLHFPGDSCYENEISADDSGESPKRRSFKPDENGMKPKNHGRAWSEKDIEIAQAFKRGGWSNAKIANHFQRNPSGIRKMLNKRSK